MWNKYPCITQGFLGSNASLGMVIMNAFFAGKYHFHRRFTYPERVCLFYGVNHLKKHFPELQLLLQYTPIIHFYFFESTIFVSSNSKKSHQSLWIQKLPSTIWDSIFFRSLLQGKLDIKFHYFFTKLNKYQIFYFMVTMMQG